RCPLRPPARPPDRHRAAPRIPLHRANPVPRSRRTTSACDDGATSFALLRRRSGRRTEPEARSVLTGAGLLRLLELALVGRGLDLLGHPAAVELRIGHVDAVLAHALREVERL